MKKDRVKKDRVKKDRVKHIRAKKGSVKKSLHPGVHFSSTCGTLSGTLFPQYVAHL